MILGALVGLKLLDICLTGEEKPGEISPRKLVPTGTPVHSISLTHSIICHPSPHSRLEKVVWLGASRE